MKVPLLDLKQQYLSIKDEINDAINNVLEHCGFVLGPEVKQLETELAEYHPSALLPDLIPTEKIVNILLS